MGDYFYNHEKESFKFVSIPKALLGKAYNGMTFNAKIVYSIFLDRVSLSKSNGWCDDQNRIYIIFPIKELQSVMNISRSTASRIMKELEVSGLLEKKRRGLGKPDLIYLRKVEDVDTAQESADVATQDECIAKHLEDESTRCPEYETLRLLNDDDTRVLNNETSSFATDNAPYSNNSADIELYNFYFNKKSEIELNDCGTNVPCNEILCNDVPCAVKIPDPETSGFPAVTTHKNNTNINNTNISKVLSLSKSLSSDDEAEAFVDTVKENISYTDLILSHSDDEGEILDEMIDLIKEISYMDNNATMIVARKQLPVKAIKSKFMKLTYDCMDYAINCIMGCTSHIKNIKKYLLAVLFNAPSTIKSYYHTQKNYYETEAAKNKYSNSILPVMA